VESYSAAVANGQVEFRATLQEESDLLVSFIKSAQDKVIDVPATIYSTAAGKAQASQAEGVVNHFYTQVSRTEHLLGAEALGGRRPPSKQRSEKPWLITAPAAGDGSPRFPLSRTASQSRTSPNTPSARSATYCVVGDASPAASSSSSHSLSSALADHHTAGGNECELLDRTPRALEWRARFKLPADESLLNDYTCAFKGGATDAGPDKGDGAKFHKGRLYVSKNHLCFHSSAGRATRVVALMDIANVQKKASGLLNNTIEVTLRDSQRLLFTQFVSRDATYQLISSLWQSALLMS
jgi:hypothetical protein